MDFFLDTADREQIRHYASSGLVDGVTTNPSLIAKDGGNFLEVLRDICAMVAGPVSAECIATEADQMEAEGRHLAAIADNIAVKVPLTPAGLRVCKRLTDDGIMVNVTLCFSSVQALLAAKAGATFVSPFLGRIDDLGQTGIELIGQIRTIYDQYAFETQILAASIRHPLHVAQAAEIGADIATMPPKVLGQLFHHPLTDKGLAAFLKDWKDAGLPDSVLEL